MVVSPDQYRWSSCPSKVTDKKDPVVDYDSCYLALGRYKKECRKAYAEYAADTIPRGGN